MTQWAPEADEHVRTRDDDWFPAGFPWGWFHVATSASVGVGLRRTVRMFGGELVVFRGTDGKVGVLDAHCPHLGAHLGDGKIIDDTIECPFHRWRFDVHGECRGVPYAARLPRARARCYPVCEWNGLILAYRDPGHAAPAIELPSAERSGIAAGATWHRRSLDVRAPIFEIAENPADVAHFAAVHGYVQPPSIDYAFDGVTSSFDQEQVIAILGRRVPIRIRARSFGPGVSVLRIEQLVDMTVVLTPVPIERELTRMNVAVLIGSRSPRARATAWIAAWQILRELRVDRRIWERKAFVARPMLCDGDGPIMKFRRWYRQFYAPAER